jgi:hypothetical protein
LYGVTTALIDLIESEFQLKHKIGWVDERGRGNDSEKIAEQLL